MTRGGPGAVEWPTFLSTVPSREQIHALPPFEPLGPEQIELVSTAAQAERAAAELATAAVLGFDTESKPTFYKGQPSSGPHVVQFSTLDRAWVIQLHDPGCRAMAARWLARGDVIKAGFGLRDDRERIETKLGVKPAGVVELNDEFHRRGFRNEVGAVGAVAVLLRQRFAKRKKAATSNWAALWLTDGQIIYAANDAYVAMRVYQALFPAGRARP